METLDRRKRKTQKAIKEALIKLASEKDLTKITVKEITETADISRKTFYLNYLDLNDLQLKMADDILADFVEFTKDYDYSDLKTDPYPFLNELTKTLSKDEFFTKMIISSSSLFMLEKIKDLLINGVSKAYVIESKTGVFKVKFIISGLIDSYKDWYMQENKTITLEDYCKIAAKLVSGCVNNSY